MRADGSALQNLTNGTPGYDGHPSFSGDGKQVVFRSERTGQSHIYVMDADGSNVHQLTEGSGWDMFPVFSPTSAQVAFVSNRDNPASDLYQIFLMELGPNGVPGQVRRLTSSAGQKGHVGFSWDGKWLVFASEEGGISDETPLAPAGQPYGELYAYRISDGVTVRVTHNKWEEGIPSWQGGLGR
jgi:TolB protein